MAGATGRLTPTELKRRIETQRRGRPFLEYRDADGELVLFELPDRGRLSVGRDAEADVTIAGDERVSRLHAELERIGGAWVIADDGLSRNGTYVGGERVVARRRLRDGDAILVGETLIVFRDPRESGTEGTVAARGPFDAADVTPAQRRVLIALCRPFATGSEFATPATNREIAAELHLTVDAVKAHMRNLFERFGVAELPQNRKRVRLAELALRSGVVTPRDFDQGTG